jgi:hypothetical protein
MTATCARPGCGKPLASKATGRPARYCSAACRVASSEARRAEGPSDVTLAVGLTKPPQRPFYRGLLCPVDPSHGRLIDWPTDRWAFYCPDQAHDGWHDRPSTPCFFTTAEAERGSLDDPMPKASAVPAVPQREEEAALAMPWGAVAST